MILTNEEIQDIKNIYNRLMGPIEYARSIEQAVIAKLSQGLEVPEQSGWAVVMHGSCALFVNNQEKNFGKAPGAKTKVFTLDQLEVAIATARVKALEDAALICESEYDNWNNERPLRLCVNMIRALKGN